MSVYIHNITQDIQYLGLLKGGLNNLLKAVYTYQMYTTQILTSAILLK